MNCRILKARRSRVKLSKALQEQLLSAIARKDTKAPQTLIQQPIVNEDHVQNTAKKRRFDAISETNSVSTKPARLKFVDTRNLGSEEEILQTTLQQPQPQSVNEQFASFLREFVDPPFQIRPGSVNTLVSEWLESVGSDREKHCRSDSHLYYSTKEPIPRKFTCSAPEMNSTQDADGAGVPPTPASTIPPLCQTDEAEDASAFRTDSNAPSGFTGDTQGLGSSSGKSLVENPLYRDTNLAANNIFMRHPCDPLPEQVASLVSVVRRDRDSPGPSLEEIRQDRDLYDLSLGATEPDVEAYFHTHLFPVPKSSDSLKRNNRQPMTKQTTPTTGSKLKVSTPVPDILYGYNRQNAFLKQRAQLLSIGSKIVANNQGLIYPFFVVEFKGDGPSGSGSLWAATNQCLGGSASCVNIAEFFNRQLRQCKSDNAQIKPISSAAFSIAMNGTEARLYISWKDNDLEYQMANIDSFLLQKPKDYIEFRKCVLNIIDWGTGERLDGIRCSLDALLEGSRKQTLESAKPRPAPSDSSTTNSRKKRKSAS
ncbi:hypothetical protein NUW58_g5078 [Xylaria curta]|uniref:Uncharacterized protein n=1 Tax=Xylaria curta TaxID=42375 RepID=A0ACC1P3D9_9PEZI|nr:hypothetical protein NUW58_g5078 [Xylaria curta]